LQAFALSDTACTATLRDIPWVVYLVEDFVLDDAWDTGEAGEDGFGQQQHGGRIYAGAGEEVGFAGHQNSGGVVAGGGAAAGSKKLRHLLSRDDGNDDDDDDEEEEDAERVPSRGEEHEALRRVSTKNVFGFRSAAAAAAARLSSHVVRSVAGEIRFCLDGLCRILVRLNTFANAVDP
jgi:hypothetical protein